MRADVLVNWDGGRRWHIAPLGVLLFAALIAFAACADEPASKMPGATSEPVPILTEADQPPATSVSPDDPRAKRYIELSRASGLTLSDAIASLDGAPGFCDDLTSERMTADRLNTYWAYLMDDTLPSASDSAVSKKQLRIVADAGIRSFCPSLAGLIPKGFIEGGVPGGRMRNPAE